MLKLPFSIYLDNLHHAICLVFECSLVSKSIQVPSRWKYLSDRFDFCRSNHQDILCNVILMMITVIERIESNWQSLSLSLSLPTKSSGFNETITRFIFHNEIHLFLFHHLTTIVWIVFDATTTIFFTVFLEFNIIFLKLI